MPMGQNVLHATPPETQTSKAQNHEPLQDDHAKAAHCISQIADPLWKNICMDLLNMMGPASVLKIWKSKLGDSEDKTLDLNCETEDIAAFIQQYDFVILGSLRRHFPALKQLKVKVISALSHQQEKTYGESLKNLN